MRSTYWKYRTSGIDDVEAAWWLVNWSEPPLYRWRTEPSTWDQCMDWKCIGKRPQTHFDYRLTPSAGMDALRDVTFRPLDERFLEGIRSGLLPQPFPGQPLPFPTVWDAAAYDEFVGKGKGKGKVEGKGTRMLLHRL